MRRLAHADAMSYWMASKIPNDQFLLYCFAVGAQSGRGLEDQLRMRAAGINDLTLRIADVTATLDRPYWVHRDVSADQIRHHDARSWNECLVVVGELMSDQLDPTNHCWRLHLIGPIPDAPHLGADTTESLVAVLQVAHSLGDGRRTASIASELFAGRDDEERTAGGLLSLRLPNMLGEKMSGVRSAAMAGIGATRLPLAMAETVGRGLHAYRLSRSTKAPHTGGGVALSRWNRPPGNDRTLRAIVVPPDHLKPFGHNVTVGALLVLSQALPDHLAALDGARADRYAIELTIGRSGKSSARNNFRNAGIDLHVDVDDLERRAGLIAKDISAARDRDTDPTLVASRRATAAAPALLNKLGVAHFDPHAVPATVTGVSVLSSVNRGGNDLELGGGAVRFTCGFPGLSPAQGLTHGLHGVGDALALTVTTSVQVEPDVDDYLARLRAAIDNLNN